MSRDVDAPMSWVLRLRDPDALDASQVGPKFASLARAYREGLPVPDSAVVTVEAERARRETGAMPPALAQEILQTAAELGLTEGLAVRSSATLEDLDGKSFAGIYESFLAGEGESELLGRVEQCWESAAREGAVAYLGHSDERPRMAVILQRMVRPELAGVAFSRDPLAPGEDRVVVEAVHGLGEALVAGHLSPWRAIITPGNVEISARGAAGEGIIEETVWREVAALSRRLEALRGSAQDVEWAIDGEGELWLLQSRPVTALERAAGSAPQGAWTRQIALDLWGDALTPFLAAAMVTRAPRFDLSRGARFVGIETVSPSLAVIGGYLYVNVRAIEAAVAALPAPLRTSDLEALLPPGRSLAEMATPSPWRLLGLTLRAAALGLVEPRANPVFTAVLSRRDRHRLRERLSDVEAAPADEACSALRRVKAALDVLTATQESNQWTYFWATVATLGIRAWLVDRRRMSHGDFLAALAGGENVTARMERRFDRLGARIRAQPTWLAAIGEGESAAREIPALCAELDALLSDYGCRGRHRALDVPRWAEAPSEVLALLRERTRHAGAHSPSRPEEPAASFVVRRALGWVRRLLDQREELRYFLDRVLFVLRRSLLDLGEVSGLGDGVFYLRLDELETLVAGGEVDGEKGGDERDRLGRSIELRRSRLSRRAEPAAFYVDGHAVEPEVEDGLRLRGTGTSPGRAAGRARLVEDPTKAAIQPGDVLVARNTDPGWTPILRSVAAVVAGEGGLLNHGSIVARELGIPAVVGVRGATQRIPEGARLTVDGSTGSVRLDEEARERGPSKKPDTCRD